LSVKDKINQAKSVINTVIGIYARNFHKIPGSNIIGRNTTSVVAVQAIRGILNSFTAKSTAVLGVCHTFIFSLAHSIITIIVSSAIPSVSKREKFVKKFKLDPIIKSTINVQKNARGIKSVEITASLNQRNKKSIANTKINVDIAFFASHT
jgi:hypothetical protein